MSFRPPEPGFGHRCLHRPASLQSPQSFRSLRSLRLLRPLLVVFVTLVTALSIVPVGAHTASAASGSAAGSAAGSAPTAAQLATIRAEAAAVQADLTAGAKKLDAARARLKTLQQRADAAKQAAAKLDTRLADLRRQIARFAGEMYENPVPDVVTRVLADDDLMKTLQAKQLLTFANGQRSALLQEANAGAQRAKSLRAAANQDAAAAAAVQKSVSAQVSVLRDKATKAAKKLEAAQAAYEAEQARLEAERQARAKAAAEAARARAAQEAARAAARARAQAPSRGYAPGQSAGAPACSALAGGTSGFSNGLIPASALCPIIGGGMLRADAAAAFNKMSQAYARTFGSPLCVNASYRPYSRQVQLFASTPSLAAVPGTSNHGWGLAVDLGCGVQNYGSAQFRWMTANAGAYGWVHPAWALRNPFEPWHWEFGRL